MDLYSEQIPKQIIKNKNKNKIIYKRIYNHHKEKDRNLSNFGAFYNAIIEASHRI